MEKWQSCTFLHSIRSLPSSLRDEHFLQVLGLDAISRERLFSRGCYRWQRVRLCTRKNSEWRAMQRLASRKLALPKWSLRKKRHSEKSVVHWVQIPALVAAGVRHLKRCEELSHVRILSVAVACWLSKMVFRVRKDVTDRSDASCHVPCSQWTLHWRGPHCRRVVSSAFLEYCQADDLSAQLKVVFADDHEDE